MATATDEQLELSEAEIEAREGFFEFINGRFVDKPSMGANANELTMLLMSRLVVHVVANRLGHCYGEKTVYHIFPDDPKRSRIPDGSFIRTGRLQGRNPLAVSFRSPPISRSRSSRRTTSSRTSTSGSTTSSARGPAPVGGRARHEGNLRVSSRPDRDPPLDRRRTGRRGRRPGLLLPDRRAFRRRLTSDPTSQRPRQG